jgi:hypothetical protein
MRIRHVLGNQTKHLSTVALQCSRHLRVMVAPDALQMVRAVVEQEHPAILPPQVTGRQEP